MLAEWVPLAPGIAGTRQTLEEMRAQNSGGWSAIQRKRLPCAYLDPRVLDVAHGICHDANAPGGDREAEARAIFNFIVRRCEYRRDPKGTDLARDPLLMLKQIQERGYTAGDCNNQANLFALLGSAIRLPMWWVLCARDADSYVHIYPAMACSPDFDLSGEPATDSELLALDTASPPAPVFGRHSLAPARVIVPATNEV